MLQKRERLEHLLTRKLLDLRLNLGKNHGNNLPHFLPAASPGCFPNWPQTTGLSSLTAAV
jgi:hypothetical protein